VLGRRRRGSIGSQSALGRSSRSFDELDVVLVGIVDRVTRRMRAARRAGRTITLRLRFGDFSRATRPHTLSYPTAATDTILTVARALLAAAKPLVDTRGITLVGIAVANLDSGSGGLQLELPLERPGRDALDRAVDEVRNRFGPKAVTRASLLRRGTRLSDYLLR
jgi:DNA polymerase IV